MEGAYLIHVTRCADQATIVEVPGEIRVEPDFDGLVCGNPTRDSKGHQPEVVIFVHRGYVQGHEAALVDLNDCRLDPIQREAEVEGDERGIRNRFRVGWPIDEGEEDRAKKEDDE